MRAASNAGNSFSDSDAVISMQMNSSFYRSYIIMFNSKLQVPHASGEHSGYESSQPALQEDPDPAGSSRHGPRQRHPAHR